MYNECFNCTASLVCRFNLWRLCTLSWSTLTSLLLLRLERLTSIAIVRHSTDVKLQLRPITGVCCAEDVLIWTMHNPVMVTRGLKRQWLAFVGITCGIAYITAMKAYGKPKVVLPQSLVGGVMCSISTNLRVRYIIRNLRVCALGVSSIGADFASEGTTHTSRECIRLGHWP